VSLGHVTICGDLGKESGSEQQKGEWHLRFRQQSWSDSVTNRLTQGMKDKEQKKKQLLLSSDHEGGTPQVTPQSNKSSFQSRNVYFNSETSSLHWKFKLRNAWGQKKRVSTLGRCCRTVSRCLLAIYCDW